MNISVNQFLRFLNYLQLKYSPFPYPTDGQRSPLADQGITGVEGGLEGGFNLLGSHSKKLMDLFRELAL